MGWLGNILSSLGFLQDVAENTRPTTTDVRDNKTSDRKYDFDDGTGYTSEDFLRERKQRNRERNKGKKDTRRKNEIDENVR